MQQRYIRGNANSDLKGCARVCITDNSSRQNNPYWTALVQIYKVCVYGDVIAPDFFVQNERVSVPSRDAGSPYVQEIHVVRVFCCGNGTETPRGQRAPVVCKRWPAHGKKRNHRGCLGRHYRSRVMTRVDPQSDALGHFSLETKTYKTVLPYPLPEPPPSMTTPWARAVGHPKCLVGQLILVPLGEKGTPDQATVYAYVRSLRYCYSLVFSWEDDSTFQQQSSLTT